MLFFLFALSTFLGFSTAFNHDIKCPPIPTCGWELMELGTSSQNAFFLS
jgi:hypothetical protein